MANMALTSLPNNAMNFTENQHGNVILEKLRSQKECGRFCDVVIYVQGKQFQAHRNVLSACSPYFESILKVQKAVKEQLTVTCQNYEAFNCLLNYMYTGTIVVDKNNVAELLRLANHFLVSKLKNYCAEYLERYLDISNCISVKELADKYGMPTLLKNAVNFIQAHMPEILQQKELLDASLSKVEQFLSDKSWNIPQDGLLKFACQWVAYSPSFRDRDLRTLLTFVSWQSIDRHLLSQQLENEILFKQNSRCFYFILQCMEENNVHLAKYSTIYHDLKAKFGHEAATNFDSDSFLNMAISTAIEGLQDVNGQTNEKERETTFDPVTVTALDNKSALQLKKQCKNNEGESGNSGHAESANLKFKRNGKLVTASFILRGGRSIRPIRLRLGKSVRRKLRNGLCASVNTLEGRKLRLFRLRTSFIRHLKRFNGLPTLTKCKIGTQDGTENENLSDRDDYDDIDDIIDSLDGHLDRRAMDFVQDCIKCPHCLFVAHSIQKLERHVSRAHSRDVTYKCGLCEFTCKWNRDYYGHMKERHFPGPPFRCDGCDYNCEQIQILLTHRMKHTDERPFKCSKCDFRCKSKNNLCNHARTHVTERPFKCHICFRGFANKATLDHHLTTHNDDRQYVCDVCNFSTKFQSHLITHKRVHSGEIFRCDFPECSYTSPKKAQLTAHNRTHTAVRTHICGVCGRGFVEKSHLVRHERIHLNEKPFKCDHCDYSSSRRDKLKEHTAKHHGAHPTAKTPYKPRKARSLSNSGGGGKQQYHHHHHHHPYDQGLCYPGGSLSGRNSELDNGNVLLSNHNQHQNQQQIQQQTPTPSSSISESSPTYSYDPQSSQHHLVTAMDLHSKVMMPDLSRSLAVVAAAAAAGVDHVSVSQGQSQVNNQQSITSVASGLPSHSHTAAAVAAAAVAASGRGQPPTMVFDPRYHAAASQFHHHMNQNLDQRPQQPGIHNLNAPNASNMPHPSDFSGLSAFMALF